MRHKHEIVRTQNATYTLITFSEGGAEVLVTTEWARVYGRCDHRIHTRTATIYTRRNFKAWLKRNNMTADPSIIELLEV